MIDTSLCTVLHISDFHFARKKQREQDIVVNALVSDLHQLCIGHRRPDITIFTGDLVQAGGIDSHYSAYDCLIDRISKVTGCSDERFFIVPGNHDLSWSGLEAFESDHRAWRKLIGLPDEMAQLNGLYERGCFDIAISTKFSEYTELEKYMRTGSMGDTRRMKNCFVTVDHVSALNIDIVAVNTAALSAGGHKRFERDERNLSVPEYALIEAIDALTPGSMRIFATHHPLQMLSEQSARYLETFLMKHANIHLFGHMHDPQPRATTGLSGSLLSNQAGATFTHRQTHYNGYALLTIDRQNGYSETLVRSYFKDRDRFDEGIDVVEGGKWWPSQAARQHFRKIAAPIDERAFRDHLSGPALEALCERQNAAGGEGDLHNRFVAPPMRRTYISETHSDDIEVASETAIKFEDLVCNDYNLILYAKSEYGRTTTLRELRFRLLLDSATLRFLRLPILLDFSDVSSNAENLLRKARGASELCPPSHDVESLLKLGHACVLIDDVQFSDTNRMRVIRAFIERFPKARYILSSPEASATKMGACINPEMPVRFEFIEIREFRRNDMRQLLAKEQRCTNVEEWLDRLQGEFREINLPFTAANGTILIEILSEKYNFTPINRAVLMEQFVDSTLRKAAVEQSRRETFDYTNKTDLLSHIAAWMAQINEYIPEKEAVRSEMRSYVESHGLNVDIDALLLEFLAVRIFISRGDRRISFRYRGVLEHFIALRMTVDSSFKEWVLEEERYLRYVNEIQYYAGRLRNDAALVDLIGRRHEAILSAALADVGVVDLAQLDSLQLPVDGSDGDIDVIAGDIASPPLSQEEKDSELEADFPADEAERQEVFRPKAKEPSDRVMLSLFLYSGLIKNVELIPDREKRRHLSSIWYGWAIFLVTALRFAPRLAKERRVRINGAMYDVQAPQGMSDATLLRHMMLGMPHFHVRLLSSALGTEKLERQLTEPLIGDLAEPKIFEFFRVALIADLRLSATPGAIKALTTKLRSNHYLLWSLVVHVGELRRLDRVKEEHFRALEGSLASALANLKGGSHKARMDEHRRQQVRLERDRLRLAIRREQEI